MTAKKTSNQAEPNVEDGALLSDLIAKHATDVEVKPDQDAVAMAMEAHAAEVKASQSKARKAKALHLDPATGATVLAPKPTAAKKAPKIEAKPKSARVIVPFDDVTALLKELGLNKSQAAKATGKSNSLWAEYTGSGRKSGLNVERWPEVQAQLRKFAKEGLK